MTVVVLGKRLRSEAAHESLRRQVDVGIRAVRETDAEYLVLSGGRTNPDVDRAESEAMRAHALERGVDEDRVVVETRSKDTIGNAYFTRPILERLPEVDAVQVVTACYHVERAVYVFERCLGSAYDVAGDYCNPTGVSASEYGEAAAFDRTRDLLGGVEPGDVESVRRRLLAEHDLYDELPDRSTSDDDARPAGGDG